MKLLIGILSFLTILILGVVYVKISTPKPVLVEEKSEIEPKKKTKKA